MTVTPELQQQWKRERSTLRRRLTIAKRDNTPKTWFAVQDQAADMLRLFEHWGYPDWWSEVNIAADDAYWNIQRLTAW